MGYPTVQEAITAAAAGDTVYLRAGTYQGTPINYSGNTECCFLVNKGLTIQPYNSEAVELTYDPADPPLADIGAGGDNYGPIIAITADDVTLDGTQTLTITGTQGLKATRGTDLDVNIQLGNGLDSITIERCAIDSGGHGAIKFQNGENIVIAENIFSNQGDTAFDHFIYISQGATNSRIVIRHNVFLATSVGRAVNLYYTEAKNCDVYGNVMYGLAAGAINVCGTGNRICNNTVYECPASATANQLGALYVWSSSATNLTIRNNFLLKSNGTGGTPSYDVMLDGANGLSGSDIGNNIYGTTNTTALTPADFDTWWADDGSDQVVDPDTYDPGFVDDPVTAWTSFRLDVGSPLIGAGGDAPFDALLDPAQTSWPTPKTVVGTLPIGAFAAT